MTHALIVIDMQEGSFTPRTARHDTAGLVDRLNGRADRTRQVDGRVVFVQHDGPADDPHHPSKPGWHILPELDRRLDDRIVHKTACDFFLETDPDAILKQDGVDTVIVTGCATEFCVDTTVRTALAHGYRTIVPSDGHTTADREHLSAVQIIRHHNVTWADLITPVDPAAVLPSADIQ